jgi:hypothetical protein
MSEQAIDQQNEKGMFPCFMTLKRLLAHAE